MLHTVHQDTFKEVILESTVTLGYFNCHNKTPQAGTMLNSAFHVCLPLKKQSFSHWEFHPGHEAKIKQEKAQASASTVTVLDSVPLVL